MRMHTRHLLTAASRSTPRSTRPAGPLQPSTAAAGVEAASQKLYLLRKLKHSPLAPWHSTSICGRKRRTQLPGDASATPPPRPPEPVYCGLPSIGYTVQIRIQYTKVRTSRKLKPLHSERQPLGQAGGALLCEWNASGVPAARVSAHTAQRLTRRAVSGSVAQVVARPPVVPSPAGWSLIIGPVPSPVASVASVKTGCATASTSTSPAPPAAASLARCPRGAASVGGSSQLGAEGLVVSAVAERK